MFITDTAEKQHISHDAADNYVHSTDDIEMVPPSPLPLSKSACIQNASAVTDSNTVLDVAACNQKRKLDSDADMALMNDVEPDDSPSSACCDSSQFKQSSRCSAVVTVIDSTCVTHLLSTDKHDRMMVDEGRKPSQSSRRLTTLQKDACLPDSQVITVSSQSQLDDIAEVNIASSSICDEIACDLVTQSSTADESFHSCATVDLDSSVVNI